MIRQLVSSAVLATLLLGVFVYSQDETALETVYTEASSGELVKVFIAPELALKAWGLFDPETGEVIDGKNIEASLPIASITKLFTAYAISKSNTLDSVVSIEWSDLLTEGSAGNLSYGETFTVRELLFPMLLESSNDAAEALYRTHGDTLSFSNKSLIESLSLDGTHIVDASGLGNKNVSSVIDLARFYAHLKKNAPYTINITKVPMYVIDDSHGWVNNNPGREVPSFTGGKHGYTDAAARTFVGTFTLENGHEVGLVILGSEGLKSDIESLLAYARERAK
jgi:serine-type D-Ala-D-Ala carboxypeptidase (penicillin-binding protein 5/6)